MSTRYAIALCDTDERAGSVLETFLDNSRKFDAIDIISGSRLFPNYSKQTVNGINDIPIAKAKFLNNKFNIYMISSFNEESNDLPRSVAYHQNMAEIQGIACIANGRINNKELIARKYDFPLGQSLQEFIVGFYKSLATKPLGNMIIENMVRDIESDYLSFVILDKNKNDMYVYNRGDSLYMQSIPGSSIIISSEILPINTTYPKYNFHRLPANCSMKIDTKTMYVQYIPINCNLFSYGKDLLIDTNKAILFTEACDMEFYTALSLLNSKDIANISDLHILYFGYNTDIDKAIFDKINKLRKVLKISGKLPTHIPYNFSNIYVSESEIIEELNKKIAEQNDIENQLDPDKKEALAKKNRSTSSKTNLNLKDMSTFDIKKINYIASQLISIALERGIGSIYIPNSNRKNNRLINAVKALAEVQVNTPLYVYSIFDDFNTSDFIRYIIGIKNENNLDDILMNSDRTGMSLEVDNTGKPIIKYNASTAYNNDVVYAFQKTGYENPFEYRYYGKQSINNMLLNSGFSVDKVMDNQQKAEFLNMITNTVRNAIEYQRKIMSF